MAANRYKIQNYNAFLKATKRHGAITHKQAQKVYRIMKGALGHPVRKVDTTNYPDLWDDAIERAVSEQDDAIIDAMLDQMQLDDSYGPDAIYDPEQEEVMLSIRGRNYSRTITASVRREGKQINLFNWRTVTNRTDGTTEYEGKGNK